MKQEELINTNKPSFIKNSAQIPNIILDYVIPRIPESETKCLLYICRRTFGFHKEIDRISYSQFIRGIKSSQGKILDYGAGLSRASVSKGLNNLFRSGIINITKSTKGNSYKVNLEINIDKVVQIINQLNCPTEIGSGIKPELVQKVDTQYPEKKEKTSSRKNIDIMFSEIDSWNKRFNLDHNTNTKK